MNEQPLGSTYTLTDRLGAGAMGTVYRGRDKAGAPFAFKVLRPEFAEDPALVQRFVQERSALTQVEHPNVVRMHDLVIEGETLAIVMDLVDGGDLRALLRRQGTLPPAEAADLAGGIASGLAAVHAAGLVHRDVKPENVLLERSGSTVSPKVTDFGIARLADAAAATRSTMALGTPNYVAPEIAEGRPATSAADVYSLGIVLYELCAGVTPFEGGSQLAVIRRHGDATAPRPEGIPDQLWAANRDMLAKDPAERPTMAQIGPYLTNLGVSLAGHPAAARLTEPLPIPSPTTQLSPAQETVEAWSPPAQTHAPERPRRRRGALVAGLLVAGLVLGGGGYLATQLLGDTPGEPAAGAEDQPTATDADPGAEDGDAAAVTEAAPSPTTEEPTTEEPTTAEPTTAEPTTAEPTTEEPTTEEPGVMPDLVGSTLSGARADLRGVTVQVVEQLDEEAVDNTVLGQSVAVGEAWPDTVELTVARRPVMVYMDSLSFVSSDEFSSETAELDGESYPRSLLGGSWPYGTSGFREWNLSRGYRQLVATVGRSDDATSATEQVQVEVFADQRKVWSERVVLGDPVAMNVDVTDVLRLRIEFTALDDRDPYLVLGDIHLLGLPGEVPEPEDD